MLLSETRKDRHIAQIAWTGFCPSISSIPLCNYLRHVPAESFNLATNSSTRRPVEESDNGGHLAGHPAKLWHALELRGCWTRLAFNLCNTLSIYPMKCNAPLSSSSHFEPETYTKKVCHGKTQYKQRKPPAAAPRIHNRTQESSYPEIVPRSVGRRSTIPLRPIVAARPCKPRRDSGSHAATLDFATALGVLPRLCEPLSELDLRFN